jgi:hypothetical protein
MKGSSTLIASVTIGWVSRVRRMRLMCLVVGGCDWNLGWFAILLDSLVFFTPPSRNPDLFLHDATACSGPVPPHYRGFTIILRHTTLGRCPLDEWSVRRRDLYLTTHKRQTSMTLAGFEPSIVPRERLQTHAWDDKYGIVQWNLQRNRHRLDFLPVASRLRFVMVLEVKDLGGLKVFP